MEERECGDRSRVNSADREEIANTVKVRDISAMAPTMEEIPMRGQGIGDTRR